MTTTIRHALVLAAVVFATVLVQNSTAAAYRTIRVNNKLSSKMAVIVHCQSGDDDLKARVVAAADSSYGWGFGWTRATVFWCRLAFRGKRLGFTAYNGEEEYITKTYVADYDVCDDGVFGTHVYSQKRLCFAEWH
ncbi:unnamed protein product [Linum tenue]|uniref:S-protein homolog n=1 Tax=Linum tenue TaxID=586396 RepID=A0AAV0IEZ4_9ROSI|nr:unnamed protein product [Linum tenue]